jgi:hypothetical protein
MGMGGKGVTPRGPGVARRPLRPTLHIFFLKKKKISLFIYFLINLYFFIQMNMCQFFTGSDVYS